MLDAKTFWDKAAAKYARSPIADMEAYRHTLERTQSHLSPTDRVLEVGCGTGSTALRLADAVAAITATDISANMIRIAEEKAKADGIANVRFVTAGLSDDALGDGPYDAVLAFNLLHLLEDAGAAVRRIHGLLKPGGLFISKTVCRPESGGSFKFLLMKTALPLLQLVGKAPFVRLMSIDELEEIVASAGFDIVETGNFPASPPSRFIVARRT